MLDIDNVWASYDAAVPVLKGVSLHVGRSDAVAVVGANGAGKSTLLRVISGLLPCSQGRIRFDGIDLTGVAAHRRVEMGLVHVPEGRQMLPEMTVEENLLLGGYVRRRDASGLTRTIEELYQLFPILKERRRQLTRLLSGGEQQMVALGRALMAEPRLLLCDEPSLGLAPLVVRDIFAALAKLRARAIPIVLVEQNAKMALKLADRGVVLRNGLVAISGTAAELGSSDEVRAAYLGASVPLTAK